MCWLSGDTAVTMFAMERMVRATEHYRLWAEARGDPDAPALLLIMGANTSGLAWPEPLVAELAGYYRVIRYDHRDTGRSTWAFDTHPYAVRDLAADAVRVLDAFDVPRAHVVGLSLGATLTQLLLLDHPDRVRSATMVCATPLGMDMSGRDESGPSLPGVAPELLALWEEMGEERDYEDELDWRVRHWRLLNGDVLPFDPDEFRAMEARVIAHAGTHRNAAAHARADPVGLDRGEELSRVDVPSLVIEGPEDPVAPPPRGARLAERLARARHLRISGMGHALSTPVLAPLAAAIREHADTA